VKIGLISFRPLLFLKTTYFLFPNTGLDSKDRVGLIENPDENKSSEYTWAPMKCETK
jgi:hypothetical protein